MPQPKKPPRLWFRPARQEWYILDGGKQVGTGFGKEDLSAAEEALKDQQDSIDFAKAQTQLAEAAARLKVVQNLKKVKGQRR